MNAVIPKLSVIICTHNPKPEYLLRVLSALRAQTLSLEQWELVIIDNQSPRPLSEWVDLGWHPHAAILVEEKLGATCARLRGFRETRAGILVYVDDDNVLAPNYLEHGLELGHEFPMLGSWGSGCCLQEFEVEPPAELKPFAYCLGRVEATQPVWSNFNDTYRSVPIGAGLLLRRVVAETYAAFVAQDPPRGMLDRAGQDLLLSGADWDLAMAAVDCRLGTGTFPTLKVTHLIKKERLNLDYFRRMHVGVEYAMTWIKHYRGTLRRPYLENRIAARIGELRLSALERTFARATRLGGARAWADIQAAKAGQRNR